MMKCLFGCFALSMVSSAGPLDQWHARPVGTEKYHSDVGGGRGLVVVIAESEKRIITTSLRNPSQRWTFDTTNTPKAVVYGAGRFVVVGSAILSSTNAIDWNTYPGSAACICFGNGLFVAIGRYAILTSGNGMDWTNSPVPSGFGAHEVTFGNNTFLADAGAGTNLISTDGISWTPISSGSSNKLYAVGFGNGSFVAIDIGNQVLTSPNGRDWNRRGLLNVPRPGKIAWGNGYIVVAGAGARAYSRDAVSWTVIPTQTTDYSVAYIDGFFVASGYGTISQSDPLVQLELARAGTLIVSGMPGQRYRIESSGGVSLSDTNWNIEAIGEISESETRSVWRAPSGPAVSQRFYRAVLFP